MILIKKPVSKGSKGWAQLMPASRGSDQGSDHQKFGSTSLRWTLYGNENFIRGKGSIGNQ